MSSKREAYEREMHRLQFSSIYADTYRAVVQYVNELHRCIRESSELKASTLELAEKRAWEAAREGVEGGRYRYPFFSMWKRRETARELTQEAEELGMYDTDKPKQ